MALSTSSSDSSFASIGRSSRLGIVPPRSSSVAPALFFDSFLELCPTIQSISALAHSSQDETTKYTRLHRALVHICSVGNVNLLAWFLEIREQGQRTARYGGNRAETSATTVEEELAAKIDLRTVREEEGGSGLVILAASVGHTAIVELLVEHGAEVDERDAAGWTPLMWAINLANLPLVAYLLQHGADIEARSNNGRTCEDFIVSLAPLEADVSGVSSPGQHSRKLELIADLVFEYLIAAVAEREGQGHSRGASFRSALSGWASPTPGSASSSNRSTSYNNCTSDGLTPSSRGTLGLLSPAQPRQRALRHKASTWSISSTSRRLVGRTERNDMQEAELKAREVAEGRRRALLEMAIMLEVEYSHLVGLHTEPSDAEDKGAHAGWAVRKGKARRREGARHPAKVQLAGLSPGCGALEVGADSLSVDFDFDRILPDQMLVLGGNDVDPLLDLLILESEPMRAPWSSRAEPANAIYLSLRCAAKYGDDDMFTNLLFGALERIEDRLQEKQENLTHLAYWLFNLTLLMHYLQRDSILATVPNLQGEYLLFFADVLNESYVVLIRDIERRLNRLLEAAMLEYEPLPLFEDVRFEGEWGFMRSLTGSVKGAVAANSSAASSPARNRFSQIFNRRDTGPASPSFDRSSRLSMSASKHLSSVLDRSPQPVQDRDDKEPTSDASASELLAKPTPRTITSLLTSALHVLQLYEVNPAVIIQAFSQVFYWLASELFNRVLTNKRYLCRSKAMQLKLNVSALEDWARSNALPLSIVSTHLAPLNQLISWIAGQSSLNEFDSLIVTMQGFKSLNPLQMKRAVRDYRFEVGEDRMSDECSQYLDQLETDWVKSQEILDDIEEEQRVRRDVNAIRQDFLRQGTPQQLSYHQRSGTATKDDPQPPSPSGTASSQHLSFASDDAEEMTQRTIVLPSSEPSSQECAAEADPAERELEAAQRAIDSLFLSGRSMADYQPPLAPGPNKESPIAQRDILYSSTMLPFAMPSDVEALIVSPGDAFGFGRGHFTGTGTATLRTARAGAVLPTASNLSTPKTGHSPSASSLGSIPRSSLSVSGSPTKPSSSLSLEFLVADDDLSNSLDDQITDDGSNSLLSGDTNLSTETSRSIFTTGKGIAAGGYWQPVPIIRENTLEKFDDLMRNVSRKWETMRARGRMRIPSTPTRSPVVKESHSSEWSKNAASANQDAETERTDSRHRLPPPPPVMSTFDDTLHLLQEATAVHEPPRPYRGSAIRSTSPKVPPGTSQGAITNGHSPGDAEVEALATAASSRYDQLNYEFLSKASARPPLPKRSSTLKHGQRPAGPID